MIALDDITAGDGEKHDIIPGKGRMANETTCRVFKLLQDCGMPVAFDDMLNSGPDASPATDWYGFRAPKCIMRKLEVVARRFVWGSFKDRHPHLPQGHILRRLEVEIFLKTSGKVWVGLNTGITYQLEKDDPLMVIDYTRKEVNLFYPGHTSSERKTAHPGILVGQKPFLMLPFEEVFEPSDDVANLIKQIDDLTRWAFLILERAWQLQGRTLVDFKVEFGVDTHGQLLLADVLDNDSWRLVDDEGCHLDKQFYRDNGALDTVAANYKLVTRLTRGFRLPRQRIILWTGSAKDDLTPFREALNRILGGPEVVEVVCSAHKQSDIAIETLEQLLRKVPDSVVIAYVGMSNAAGPILSAHTSCQVITVPQGLGEFQDDVWSSLRCPSNVPSMTMLSPANAVQSALQILGRTHPGRYAALQVSLEERMTARP